ncbi:MAG TPA: hypothetical protein PKE20_07385, partial [Promineifilum sp.]|nr:hypothetical protein [Promineifilum sp.]
MYLLIGLPLLASVVIASIPEPADVVFLGDAGEYIIGEGSNFIVKRTAPLRFVLVPGPTYTAVTNERVWAITGENQSEPIAIRKTKILGNVPSGCEVNYVGIDDDEDGRFGLFKLDDVTIHTMPQGMVFSSQFTVPSAGRLVIEEADSVGLWLSLCENLTPPPTTPPPTTPPPTTPP